MTLRIQRVTDSICDQQQEYMSSTIDSSAKCERAKQIAALILALGISALVLIYREQILRLGAYGYLGLFIVSIVGSATVVFPVPGVAATFIAGGLFNPLIAGVVSGAGMALGELSGYLAGYAGNSIVETRRQQVYERLVGWMEKRGFITILIMSAIPNPVFDVAGIAAGILRFPVWKFLLACFIGKSIKGILFALAGARWLPWLSGYLN